MTNEKEVIVNSNAIIFTKNEESGEESIYRYDPIGLNIKYSDSGYENPVAAIPFDDHSTNNITGAKTLYEKYGIIYMYKCSKQ